MSQTDLPELLARTDRWQLGIGGPLVFAPRWPRYLRTPGFWDACRYHGLRLRRLLCISFALEVPGGGDESGKVPSRDPDGLAGRSAGPNSGDEDGGRLPPPQSRSSAQLIELDPYLSYWHWYPDRIQARHYLVERLGIGYKQQAGVRVFMEETRRIEPDATLSCDIRFDLLKGFPTAPLHIVAWTLRDLHNPREAGVGIALTGSRNPDSTQLSLAHRASPLPLLRQTPMWEPLARDGRLAASSETEDATRFRFMHSALHWQAQLSDVEPWELTIRGRVATL